MSDLLDKAILVGLGLEKKAKEVLEELEKSAAAGAAGDAGLSAKQRLENRFTEDGTKILKDFLAVVKAVKGKMEEELTASSGKILEKVHAAKEEDVEVIKEMARVAREKVDKLEKRVEELEARVGKGA